MPITDQVATAPGTDPIQVRFLTFDAKLNQPLFPGPLHTSPSLEF